jgi:DNA modification methylase
LADVVTWQNRILSYGTAKASSFKANPLNWRTHNQRQNKALKGSLDTLGWVQTIILNQRTGFIVDGHERVEAALRNGDAEVPFITVDLSPEEEAQALLSLDAIAALAQTDADKVDELLRMVETDNTDVMQFLTDMAKDAGLSYGQPPEEAPEPQIDRAAELQEKWQTELGQLWEIGQHRLICGDCTDKAVVDRVMGDVNVQLCFTSPPYAAQRDYDSGAFDWDALMFGMSNEAIKHIDESGAFIVNLGLVHKDKRVVRYWDKWLDYMDGTEWPLFDWYVWDKLNGLMGDWRGRLAPAHEWIFHFANKPRRANKTEPTKYTENGVTHYKRDQVGLREKNGQLNEFTQAGQPVSQEKVADSVIRCQPARGGVEGHPAPFSVDFASNLISAFSNLNEVAYEPFCGSGTTIVACERLSRKCRAIEISPAYVAVSLQRLADMGLEPRLVE